MVDEISGPTRKYFVVKDNGAGLAGVVIVLICRDPNLHLKRRIRFATKKKTIYMDTMLDLPVMKAALPAERKRIIAQQLSHDVAEVLSGYKILDFKKDVFVDDFYRWIDGLGWR